MLDLLKDPKISAAAGSLLAVAIFLVWNVVTGGPPPAVVIDAIEEHTAAVIDCDDAGADCSIAVKAGSGEPSEDEGAGDAEGSE